MQDRSRLDPGVHTNADLLITKTRKGIFFAEAIALHEIYQMMNRTNYRKYGNADQVEEHGVAKIKDLKAKGKANFSNKTLVKFW